MIQRLLADCQRRLNRETVAIVDRVGGEHAVDMVHGGDHSCKVGDFSGLIVILFTRATREEERRVLEHLIIG